MKKDHEKTPDEVERDALAHMRALFGKAMIQGLVKRGIAPQKRDRALCDQLFDREFPPFLAQSQDWLAKQVLEEIEEQKAKWPSNGVNR